MRTCRPSILLGRRTDARTRELADLGMRGYGNHLTSSKVEIVEALKRFRQISLR